MHNTALPVGSQAVAKQSCCPDRSTALPAPLFITLTQKMFQGFCQVVSKRITKRSFHSKLGPENPVRLWVLMPLCKCRTAGDAAVRGECDGCGWSPGVRPRAGSEAEPQGLPAGACHLQRGQSLHATCLHCSPSSMCAKERYVFKEVCHSMQLASTACCRMQILLINMCERDVRCLSLSVCQKGTHLV